MSRISTTFNQSVSFPQTIVLLFCTSWLAACAKKSSSLEATPSKSLVLERSAPLTRVPLEIRMSKLFVTATVEDQTREFIFDTGSPTILSRELADALELEYTGSNTGQDANGSMVTMDTAVVPSLTLGDLTFHQVPVLVFDFDQLYLGSCMFDGGVLGSELLPGSVWRFDTENGLLQIADASQVSTPSPTLSAPMTDMGYPHYPVVDYEVGDVTDKAIFDTGNSGELVVFSRVMQDPTVQAHIVSGSVRRGAGSDGVSAGGAGPIRELTYFSLSDVSVGGLRLNTLKASTRDIAPTLLGAGLFDRYVVTLDGVRQRFILEERTFPTPSHQEVGYTVTLEESGTRVTQLFDSSSAAKAGLQLGDQVLTINGYPVDGPEASERCELNTFLREGIDWSTDVTLTVKREAEEFTLQIPSIPQD